MSQYDQTTAGIRAVAHGRTSKGKDHSQQYLISCLPGSERPGVQASETSQQCFSCKSSK